MANETLEKNQETVFNNKLAKYLVKAEYNGEETEEEAELDATTSDVRLYFFRYGLFQRKLDNEENVYGPEYKDESIKQNAVLLEEEKAELLKVKENTTNTSEKVTTLKSVQIIALKGLPSLENFYLARTALNLGYIYLINEDDPDDHHELQIDEEGQFQHIRWQYNKDNNGEYIDDRKPDGDKRDFKTIAPGKKIRVAYSPVQWSISYHYEINTDAEKRKKRMQLVDCSGIKKGEEDKHKNAVSFKDVKTVFPEDHPRAFALKKTLDKILVDEKNQDDEGENEFFEDMFVTLNDPFGLAHDVNNVVSDKVLSYKALIEAIHTGESQKYHYDRLIKGIFDSPAPKPEYQAMFSLALTTYHFVYNSNETSRDYDGGEEGYDIGGVHPEDDHMVTKRLSSYGPDGYKPVSYTHDFTWQEPNYQTFGLGNGVSHGKITGILGVKKREIAREIALSFRDDLGLILSSDYLKDKGYLDDYLKNNPSNLLKGREYGLELLGNLIVNPIIFEKTLILKRHHPVGPDKWTKWAYEIIDDDNLDEFKKGEIKTDAEGFEGVDPFFALLSVGLNIPKVIDKSFDTGSSLFGVFGKKLEYHAGQTHIVKGTVTKIIEVKARQQFILSWLNKNATYKSAPLWEMRDGDIVPKIDGATAVELDIVKNQDEYFSLNNKRHPLNPKSKSLSANEKLKRLLQSDAKLVRSEWGNHVLEIGVKGQKEVTTVTETELPKSPKLSKFVNSRGFTGFFAALELINFNNAVATAIKEDKWKSKFQVMEATFKITEASMTLIESVQKYRLKTVTDLFSVSSKVIGVVGAVFSAGICFWDASDAFNKRDPDSAWALVGAGVAFTVTAGVSITVAATAASGAVAASIATIGTSLGLLGPVGWIAALVGLGFLVLSQIFSDKRLQTFFKFYLLSDLKTKGFLIAANESPMDYNRRLYKDRSLLVDHDEENAAYYMDPLAATALFLDLVVCTRMTLKVETYDSEKKYTHQKSGISTYEYNADKVVANFTYYKFFNNKDQVKTKIYFLPNGISGVKEPIEKPNNYCVNVIQDPELHDAIEVSFNVSETDRRRSNRRSKILFLTRLKINENGCNYFPYPIDNEERWLGTLISIFKEGSMGSFQVRTLDFKAGTLSHLKNEDTW